MKGILWSIRKPHTDNIKSGKKWDEIRKRIPKDLSPLVPNYIYETKANGGCGKVIGEFRVSQKTYIYAYENNGEKHLGNTAFIMPALTDEDLYNYLCSGKNKDGWALRIDKLKIYDKPKELSEFKATCNKVKHYETESKDFFDHCLHCEYLTEKTSCLDSFACGKFITRPPQSWCYVESLGE